MSKSNLKGHPNKSFTTEDLISANQAMIKELLPLKKSTKVHSFWTSDGKIYAKTAAGSTPKRLSHSENVFQKLQLTSESSQSGTVVYVSIKTKRRT